MNVDLEYQLTQDFPEVQTVFHDFFCDMHLVSTKSLVWVTFRSENIKKDGIDEKKQKERH